jgi:catechol 2,3-dioxygenase-like lactoylglutathione lyase family enzyme
MATLDAIGLVVDDMAEAIDFYRKLGLRFTLGTEADGHVEATAPGGLRMMFDTREMMKSFSEWEAPSGSHRVALAFLCDGPADVDRLHLELTVGGARSHLAPFDAPWGQRYATVLDPAGNAVDLFAPIK